MLKAFRKYNKWILAIGGTLLMISFLAPQAVQQLRGDPTKRVVASLGDEKVRHSDLQKASMEFKALERFDETMVKDQLRVENSDHWFLLTRAAEKAGLVGEHGDGEAFFAQWARELTPRYLARLELQRLEQQSPGLIQALGLDTALQFAQQQALRQLNDPRQRQEAESIVAQALTNSMHMAMGETRLTQNEFYQALAKARGVFRLMNTYVSAARVSDRQAITESADRADTVYADVVLIPADRALAGIGDPTPEQLQANFEKYRDVPPGQGEAGIGYRLPNRVKIEWLELSHADFESAVTVDPVEIRKRQTKDRQKDPAGFAQERAQIEADLRSERVAQLIADADKFISAQIRGQLRKLESDGEFKKLPADWAQTRPSWESIAQKVVEGLKTTQGVTIPLPKVVSKTGDWLSAQDLAALPGIGQAALQQGPRTIPLVATIMDVKELGGKGGGIGLQVNVPVVEPAAQDAARNRYYFTVVDAQTAAPPQSLDEVRDQVVREVRLLHAFDKLTAESESLKQLVASQGIDAVAKLYETPPGAAAGEPAAVSPLPVRRAVAVLRDRVSPADPALDRPEFRTAVRDAGLNLDPLAPVDAIPVDQRTLIVPLPHDLSLAVCVLVGHRPLTAEDYRRAAGRDMEQLAVQELRAAAGDQELLAPFSLKSLSERLRFKYKREEEKS